MNILFFDTETTGKTNFRAGPEHPSQPHLVQFGAILTDNRGDEIASMDVIVKPDGWTIPTEAAGIHGITTEIATEKGRPLAEVIGHFVKLARMADLFVAHNIDFDRLVIQTACYRLKAPIDRLPRHVDPFGGKNAYCTMKSATPICRLLGPYGFKWPTLTEAYRHFFDREFDGAHDAMADVRACRDIYFALRRREPMELIYLASPYTHEDPAVQQARFETACRAAAHLMNKGHAVFSPIAHTHPIACAGDLPKGWDFWERYDRTILAGCHSMMVLQLDGWQQSRGVQAEIAIMRELGKPVEYMAWPVAAEVANG